MRFSALSILLSTLLASSAYGTTPDGNGGCGGVAQRACCLGETDPAGCDTGNREVLTVGDKCPGGVFNAGFCVKDTSDPNEHTHCGGDGQRACCTTEGSPSCDTGNIEIASTGGTCPGSFSGSAGHCVAITACGGPGQRACCNFLTEFSNRSGACNTDAAPVVGCVGNCYCGGIGTGQLALHTCVAYQTACGGDGQRACCVIERPADPCNDGLVPLVGISGDATCSDGITTPNAFETCVSVAAGPIAEPDPGWTPPATPRGGPLRGYADMHVHLLSHLAHGGSVFAGHPAPIGDDGHFVLDAGHNINTALSPALDIFIHGGPFHLPGEDTVGFGTNDGAASNFGAPYFNGWPLWNSTTHQQVYYKWLERAWRGGLRLMTMFAVTNEALCGSNDGTDCANSMGPINQQLDLVLDFERFIDQQSGGPGAGWFRIVRTPAEARTAIRNGKMAVVLGIEVDNLFNCKETGCAPPFDLGAAMDEIYAKGVRHVFPVHNFDNAFGAAAAWQDAIGVGQAYSERRWWEVEDCGGTGNDAYGFWLDPLLAPILAILGFDGDVPTPLPAYINGDDNPNYASCNTRGLRKTPDAGNGDLGARLLGELMNRGMIIDIDHMSRKALDDTLAIASARNPAAPYPVVASHVQFFSLHEREFDGNAGRHERMRTPAQLAAIKAGGGMIAAMLKDDVQDTSQGGKKFTLAYTPAVGAAIADDCRTSSKTWAQALQYGVDAMGAPVAMGSDFNGIAAHVGPRFGSDACGGAGASNGPERPLQELAGNRIGYPFTIPGFGSFAKQTTGFKEFDYNVDGLAHIGLLPDLVADLGKIGLDPYYVDALFCSAEKYIRVWERGLAIAGGQPVPDPDAGPWLCTSTGPVCGNGVLEDAEGCDDGNTTDGDGCSAVCVIEQGYACTGDPSACTPICGDGLAVGSERCDEGAANGTATSCCSASCTFAPDGAGCATDQDRCTDDVCGSGTCTHPSVPRAATFLSIDCRLAALRATVLSNTNGRLQRTLLKQLDKAIHSKETAEAAAATGKTGKVRAGLRSADRRLISFGYRVTSLAGRHMIVPPTVADDLLAQQHDILADMDVLRAGFQ